MDIEVNEYVRTDAMIITKSAGNYILKIKPKYKVVTKM